MDRRSRLSSFALLGVAALGVGLSGCAKFPDVAQTDATRVIFRFDVSREIRSDYVYIVAIRTSTDPNPDVNGPVPVVNYPAANGFVAGAPDYYVRWDPLQSRAYILYQFTQPDLTVWREVGIPITQVDVTPGGRTLQFELTVDQLAGNSASAGANLQALQVNFLTMNRISQSTGSGRVFDSLGDNRLISELNSFVRIPLATSGIYDNSRFSLLEPTSGTPSEIDCVDPDLDIVDWYIEVRRP